MLVLISKGVRAIPFPTIGIRARLSGTVDEGGIGEHRVLTVSTAKEALRETLSVHRPVQAVELRSSVAITMTIGRPASSPTYKVRICGRWLQVLRSCLL